MLATHELLTTALVVSTAALTAAGLQAARNEAWRFIGRPMTMAVVGVAFTLSAGIIALVELPNTEQLPPAWGLRLGDDQKERRPGS